MQDIAKDVAVQTVPWKAGQSWWVAGIEGIVALAVGVYIMADPFGASDLIRFLIALVLLLDSAGHIVEGFRSRDLSSTPWETLRGGIGATVAVLTILSAWSDYVADDGARQMLAIGLLTYRSTGFRTAAIIADLLTIVLGILLLSASSGDTGGTRLLGAAAAVGGIALLGYSWYLRGKPGRESRPAAATGAAPETAPDRDAV